MRTILLFTTALFAPIVAYAEDQAATATSPAPASAHGSLEPAIVVTAPFRRERTDLLSAVDIVSGLELQRETRVSLGETLSRQAGVSATSYAPGASRPILRGQQGERVRILRDGIGSIDVSNTSVDHAPAVNPLLAERIEVVRGPATLLYGSSAIGGVVNVIDRRIPRALPEEAVHFEGLAGYGSAADELSGGGLIDLPLGGGFVAHVDGSYLRTRDQGIGGFVLSRDLREEAEANGETEAAELKDRIPNTDSRFYEFAGSLAWVGERGNIGVSVSRLKNFYGIPIRYSTGAAKEPGDEDEEFELTAFAEEEEEGVERVALDLRQTRVDLRAGYQLDGFLDSASFRFGWADYQHDEIARDEGEVETSFFNTGYEGRLELGQTKRGPWRAVHGFQFASRDLDAVGAEAYLPQNETRSFGLFTLHEFDLGALRAEGGLRYDHQKVASDVVDFDRGYDSVSFSAGASYAVIEGWRAGINLSRSERAPVAEELLAFGPHVGTQAFEIGNPGLKTEKARGVELFFRGGAGDVSFDAAFHYTNYKDYIDQFPTGEIEDGLPVFVYLQADAEFWGFEVEAGYVFARAGSWTFEADALVDYVQGEIDSAGPAPRIPPLRVLGGIDARGAQFVGRVEVEHATSQDRTAAFETETDGYTMVNASLSWRPWGPDGLGSLTLAANNLGDVSARRHSSFLKDYAPLAGRDIRLTLRLNY